MKDTTTAKARNSTDGVDNGVNTPMGLNKTGLDMSPMDAKALLAGVQAQILPMGNEGTIAAYKSSVFRDGEVIGTVPIPGTVKGMALSGLQKLMGKHPETLLDQLGGRLGFERGGTRLYDAFLAKCQMRADETARLDVNVFRRIRDEEASHFALVWQAIKELGADPTAQTPDADLNAVATMGLMQILNDPRTSVSQALHALHIAELADVEGWGLLVNLAKEAGQDTLAESFLKAMVEEEEHLRIVREHVSESALATLR